jgi:hypothetical protein
VDELLQAGLQSLLAAFAGQGCLGGVVVEVGGTDGVVLGRAEDGGL